MTRSSQFRAVPITDLDSPVFGSKKRKRDTGPPPFLQAEEVERLFKVIKSPRDRALFRITYHAGLRASEVGVLEMRDYDPRTERMNFRRLKGSRAGIHRLVREEVKVLRAWLKIRGSGPGCIFPSRKHAPISRQRLDALMKQYGAAAKIPFELCHFHILKHSCATHLLAKGYHVDQVQDWLGHADIRNTMIYAHTTNARRDEMGETRFPASPSQLAAADGDPTASTACGRKL